MAVPSLLYPITVHISSSDRLVDCTSLKRATEFVYSAILPQASKPFIYCPSIFHQNTWMSIYIQPKRRLAS
uniref:Uncharacterized protein n=1 Tax=Aegilops tauschii subsp. strangulata TaxID=200361 RepID=A0A453GRH3_AEGTS